MRTIELDGEQRDLADTARRFCDDMFRDDGEMIRRRFDRSSWTRLADLGLLSLATGDGLGGALHIVAVMEQLGRAGFIGPLAETFAAGQLLPRPERDQLAAGAVIATFASTSRRVPWAPIADIFIQLAPDGLAYRATPASPVTEHDTLGHQPWGAVETDPSEALGPAERPAALADIARAAYVAGAAGKVVEIAAEYVRHRRQFGRSLGEFQAVAHPLAECHARAAAARAATLLAAHHFDLGGELVAPLAAAARLSATDAVSRTAYVGHQAMGGMGFVEGTLLTILTRIARVETLAPPGPDSTRETAMRRFAVPVRA